MELVLKTGVRYNEVSAIKYLRYRDFPLCKADTERTRFEIAVSLLIFVENYCNTVFNFLYFIVTVSDWNTEYGPFFIQLPKYHPSTW